MSQLVGGSPGPGLSPDLGVGALTRSKSTRIVIPGSDEKIAFDRSNPAEFDILDVKLSVAFVRRRTRIAYNEVPNDGRSQRVLLAAGRGAGLGRVEQPGWVLP
jgi:hypothetical protein